MSTTLISVVVPVYNEEATIEIFYNVFKEHIENLQKYTFEYIFVNDGSRDNTVESIKKLIQKDSDVKLLNLSRNFGKEGAILAGLEFSKGDAVLLIDVDLQDPPSLIPKMIEYYEMGYDNIYTKKRNRIGEPAIRSLFANTFYQLINSISDVKIINGVRDYRLMSRRAITELVNLKEVNRFSKGLFEWIGYNSICLEFDHIDRSAGQTKWSFFSLVQYALNGIVAFSNIPLKIASYLGIIIALFSFAYLLYVFFQTILFGNETQGWPSLISIILFLGGIQLIFLGVLGEYIGKIYNEVKGRPAYILESVEESVSLKSAEIKVD